MPQINVNDEEVTLIGWHVADGREVAADQPLCEVETSKAVGDVPSPASGVVKQAAEVGDVIAIGQVFAYIGPSIEAIDAFIAAQGEISSRSDGVLTSGLPVLGVVNATAGAIELARKYEIDLATVPASGRVRRSDVERFIAEKGLVAPTARPAAAHNVLSLPPALKDKVVDQGPLPDHLRSVGEHLARTQSQLVVAHVVMDVCAKGAAEWIEARRRAGVMTGSIPILLHAAAAAIAAEPRLRQFRLGGHAYAYRDVDVAFTARSGDGRLFTPVVRGVERFGLDDLAKECARLGMAVFRGGLTVADMCGACMTVSVLSEHPVRFHVGLQNAWQSAILTAGAIRDEVRMDEGRPVSVPVMTLALSYDHGLMDGWEAADALNAARSCIEAIRP
ncbi:MAG: 2-oxo acid dehydrogenase subunit E2 [Phycisphaerae bacterium]